MTGPLFSSFSVIQWVFCIGTNNVLFIKKNCKSRIAYNATYLTQKQALSQRLPTLEMVTSATLTEHYTAELKQTASVSTF